MSLMRKSVRGFVSRQLQIREALLSLGDENSRYSSINFDGLSLPKGAFYSNAISKQAVIRMYSGTDIHMGTFPEYTDELHGVTLAKSFMLEGGTGYDFDFPERKREDSTPVSSEFNAIDQKSGFVRSGGSGWKSLDPTFKGAYGNTNFRAHPHKGYGIVPMPGITNADVRTISDYGSLRLAKVNFVCHNLPQLEILEMLYMRPGYPILVEWGWLPYVDNTTGKLEQSIPYFADFWDKDQKLFDMHSTIIKNKATRSGNYDAVLGFCKNFEYTARHDGGFDCFTEVMGYGEIMQGLQGRSEVPPTGYYDDKLYGTDNLPGKYVPESTDSGSIAVGKTRIKLEKSMVPDWILGSEESSANLDNFAWIISALAYYTRPTTTTMGPDDLPHEIQKTNFKKATGWDGTTVSRPTNSFEKAVHKVITLLTNISPNVTYEEAARDIADHYCVNGAWFNHNIFDWEKSNENPPGSISALREKEAEENTDFNKYDANTGDLIQFHYTDTVYLRWDFLVEILNKFVINQHADSKDSTPLAKYTVFTPEAMYWDVPNDYKWKRWDMDNNIMDDEADHPLQGERRWDFGSYVEMAGPPILKPELARDFEEVANNTGQSYFIRSAEHAGASGVPFKSNWLSTSFDPTIAVFPGQTIASHGLTTGGATKDGGTPDPQHGVNVGVSPAVSNTPAWKEKYGQTHNGVDDVTSFNKMKKIPRGSYDGRHAHFDASIDQTYLGMSDKYIGLVYIEYKFLIELWKKEYKKKDFSYFNFISKVWQIISEDACCGNHEFILHTDETQSTIRVIDLKVDPSMAPPSNMYSFKVQDKDSIVRDFTFSSAIPDSISATIAIAAQSPDSMNEDTTTLSAFSNNISSRFSSFTGQKDDKIASYYDLILRYMEKASHAYDYWQWIYLGYWQRVTKKQVTSAKEMVKETIKMLHMLNNINPRFRNTGPDADNRLICNKAKPSPFPEDPSHNMEPYWQMVMPTAFNGFCRFAEEDWVDHDEPIFNTQSLNTQNTSLIPINITLIFDGISGIRIGDVVKISNPKAFPRLPKAYQRDDVYWVVFGDNHKITSGQDWEQELTLQLTLMGDMEYGKKESRNVTVSSANTKKEIEKETKILVDALGNPRSTGPVSQPAGWINPAVNTTSISNSQAFTFAERTLTSGPDWHNGVDIQPGNNKNGVKDLGVYMPKQAEIVGIGPKGICGNLLKFKFKNPTSFEPQYGLFCHLDEYNTHASGDPLKVGDTIEQGKKVGTIGKTGCGSCGKHLHYGLSMTSDFTSPSEETNGVDPNYYLSTEDNITDFGAFQPRGGGPPMVPLGSDMFD